MLKIIELSSWSEFEKIIKEELLEETQEMRNGYYFYRGHSDATWQLETTLERYIGQNITVDNYYRLIARIQAELETFTDRKWELPSIREYVSDLTPPLFVRDSEVHTYMGYLRHFGFPSPLLDRTYSPFVAAYFAFRDVASKAKSIAIYQFVAKGELPTIRISETTQIYPIYASSQKNKRHYLQQSVYTVCLRKTNESIYYASHEDPYVVGTGEDTDPYGEDLIKFIIPSSERITALHSLDAYNINAYSLIGTEESLLETLFLRDYKMRLIAKRIFPDVDENKLS